MKRLSVVTVCFRRTVATCLERPISARPPLAVPPRPLSAHRLQKVTLPLSQGGPPYYPALSLPPSAEGRVGCRGSEAGHQRHVDGAWIRNFTGLACSLSQVINLPDHLIVVSTC